MKSAQRNPRPENEVGRRLYRTTCETVQRLDYQMKRLTSFGSLFSDELTDLRSKLKDYCESLVFTDPVEYGKKAEDLLWHKVYYEFFHRCKQNRKRLKESEYYQHTLHSHLLAAIGFYHHMLQRIQMEYHIDLDGQVNVHPMNHQKALKNERLQKYQETLSVDQAIHTWAKSSCHRILIYLGDLARYIAELLPEVYPEAENRHLSERYYLQAFCLNVRNGTPWNQMGSLAANRFEAAYNYMRCLSSIERFDAAEGNLIRIFVKNDPLIREIDSGTCTSIHVTGLLRFLAKFLKLCEMFFFGSDDNWQRYCQDALQDFDSCMASSNELEERIEEGGKTIIVKKDEVIFKATIMCMMCIAKLHERANSDVSIATAFALALYSSIVHFTTNHLISVVYCKNGSNATQSIENKQDMPAKGSQHLVSEERNPLINFEDGKKKANGKKSSTKKKKSHRLNKLRRRRKMSSTSQDDSELSDAEALELAESEEENGVISDASRNGSCSSESLSEQEFGCEQTNLENQSKSLSSSDIFIDDPEVFVDSIVQEDFHNEVLKEPTTTTTTFKHSEVLLPAEKLFDVLDKNKLLASLKILVNWLTINKDIMQLCSESLKFFFVRLIELFNLLLKLENQLSNSHDFSRLNRNSRDWMQAFPLPEDILLQGFPALEAIHSRLSFDVLRSKALQLNEQVFLRIQCILSFGDSLCYDPKSSVHYNKDKDVFYLDECQDAKPEVKIPKTPSTNKPTVDGASATATNADSGDQRQQLMQEMAHLWLKDEVNNLEKSIQKNGHRHLSPLLVADSSTLSNHLPLLKQLVATKNFVVIVPNIVIDNLDQVKKKSAGAREAIRWLEYVFQKGNRHIRAQRDNERCPVNPIKYPKRKDKDSWDFFQILECCHFLAQQQQSALQPNCSLVTLLVGTHHHLPGNSTVLAESLNVSMENIESFFSKWHMSSKKPG